MPSAFSLGVAAVLAARGRLRGHVLRTPLRRSEWLSSAADRDVYLKLESLQPTGSFKIRGALNAALRHVERHGGASPSLVTASAGNHGRALAYAAERLGLTLTVYLPHGAPHAKQDAIRAHGARLMPVPDYDRAEQEAKAHAASGGATFVSPYADEDVIAGAGTIAFEIFEDLPQTAAIVTPLGGGGLASGMGMVARAVRPATEVIGSEAEASTAFTTSLAAGRITSIMPGPTLADGLAGNIDPDSPTFEIVRATVARVVTVSEAELEAAMRGLAAHEHLIAEGAGAAAVAAICAGKIGYVTSAAAGSPIVAIISGANVDLDRLPFTL